MRAPKRMLFGLNFGPIISLNLPLFVLTFPPFLSLVDASLLLFLLIRLLLSVSYVCCFKDLLTESRTLEEVGSANKQTTVLTLRSYSRGFWRHGKEFTCYLGISFKISLGLNCAFHFLSKSTPDRVGLTVFKVKA